MRKHIRYNGSAGSGAGTSGCGRLLTGDAFVVANPEAVTCGSCQRTWHYRLALDSARRAPR